MNAPLTHDEEVLQRLRRIETKIHKWGIRLGLEPAAPSTTIRVEEFHDRIIAYVPGYDITLSQIRSALEEAKIVLGKTDRIVYLVQEDALLATIRLTGHP